MRCRWLRLTAALIAAGCAVVVWQIADLVSSTAPASPLMIGVVLIALIVGIAGVGLSLAPRWFLQRLLDKSGSLLSAVRAVEPQDDRPTGQLLIGMGVLTYVLLVGWLLSLPGPHGTSDEGAFLKTATAVHQSGGPLQLVADLYGGRFPEANRHPLYIALLSLRPTEPFGRSLAAFLGLVTLVSLTLLTAHRRGMIVAGLFCILLATNMAFCRFSTRIVCDVLMVLWGGLVFLLVTRQESLYSRQGSSMPLRGAVLIGALLGMAYLTKGTGLLLLVGTMGAFGLMYVFRASGGGVRGGRVRSEADGPVITGPDLPVGQTRPRDRELDHAESAGARRLRRPALRSAAQTLPIVLSGWMLVASPLLVRNVRMYGTPLYNTNTWLLFVDAFEPSVALSQRLTVAEVARAYWESHTVFDLVRREVFGLAWETFILLRTLGPCPLEDSRALFGLPLAVLAMLALVARPSGECVLLASWTALFVLFFAWYVPIAAGDRFLFPLLAPLLIVAAEGFDRVLGMGANGDSSRHRKRIRMTAVVWCAASILLCYGHGPH